MSIEPIENIVNSHLRSKMINIAENSMSVLLTRNFGPQSEDTYVIQNSPSYMMTLLMTMTTTTIIIIFAILGIK
jgi:hypothetical protein